MFFLLVVAKEIIVQLLLGKTIWHDAVNFIFHDVQSFYMPNLHLFPGVLHLLDFKLHLIKVSLYPPFVLLVAQVYFLQALAELILLPFESKALRVRLVKLLT